MKFLKKQEECDSPVNLVIDDTIDEIKKSIKSLEKKDTDLDANNIQDVKNDALLFVETIKKTKCNEILVVLLSNISSTFYTINRFVILSNTLEFFYDDLRTRINKADKFISQLEDKNAQEKKTKQLGKNIV
jgi:hypothetical protein